MKLWWVNLPKKYFATAHILWAVVVFGLHAMPSNTFPKISFWENLGPDKIVHAIMFFVATALAVFSGWGKLRSATVWICAGVLLEYDQYYFTTDRSFDWFDVLADSFGVLLALLLLRSGFLKRSENQ
jgi:hypothetical protein